MIKGGRIFPVHLATALLAGCASGEPTSRSQIAPASEIAASYSTMQRITERVVLVNPEIAMLCRGPTQAEVDEAVKWAGPHATAGILIYMNELAAAAFRSDARSYPVGAVVVKEKVSGATGVGGMVKRAPGYDSRNGDWEYFYFEDPSRVESGRISSCVNCHQSARDRDYVFGTWRRGA